MNPFFLVGCPRSGTTMVQQALNRHSGIVIPPETKYFFSFLGHSYQCQLLHIERLNRDLNICLPAPAKAVSSVGEARAFYRLMARQYVERLRRKDVAYFGEKTPEHTGHLPRIRQLFPEAKILVLSRDGRDVAASLAQMPWMPAGLYVSFLVWLYYERLLRRAKEGGWPNLYFVRYEDIVADPEKEFAGMLRFLDLPYEPSVARGFGNREGIPEREFAWKGKALEPITAQRVGTFRRDLTADEIAVLERLGGRTLTSLGYPLLTDGKAPLSPGLLWNLTRDLVSFAYQLPWHSVINEVFGRSPLCRPAGSSRSAGFFRPLLDALSGLLPGWARLAVSEASA